jgi:hypothetical protein
MSRIRPEDGEADSTAQAASSATSHLMCGAFAECAANDASCGTTDGGKAREVVVADPDGAAVNANRGRKNSTRFGRLSLVEECGRATSNCNPWRRPRSVRPQRWRAQDVGGRGGLP